MLAAEMNESGSRWKDRTFFFLNGKYQMKNMKIIKRICKSVAWGGWRSKSSPRRFGLSKVLKNGKWKG